MSPFTNPSAAVTAIAAPSPTPASSSNTGGTVGGAVGGCAGVVLLAFAFWYFIMRRKMKLGSTPPNDQLYQGGGERFPQSPKEAPTHEIKVEADSMQARQELEVRHLR